MLHNEKGISLTENLIEEHSKRFRLNDIKVEHIPFVEGMNVEDAKRYIQWNKYADVGIEPVDRIKLIDWDYPPDIKLYLYNKNIYDNPDYFNQLSGKTIYPGTSDSASGRVVGSIHKDGFLFGVYNELKLQPGMVIDRFGNNESGKYFAPVGSSFESRSLPPFMKQQSYSQYMVLSPVASKVGIVAPWFDEVGMGTQYLTDMTLRELIENGYIIKIN